MVEVVEVEVVEVVVEVVEVGGVEVVGVFAGVAVLKDEDKAYFLVGVVAVNLIFFGFCWGVVFG